MSNYHRFVGLIRDQAAYTAVIFSCVLGTEKIVKMIYYWVYELKWKHLMLFEDSGNWDTVVNCNNISVLNVIFGY